MGLIEDQDAQFMLLAGFIIAVGLVVTTVMLNSIIFEGNMAVGTVNDPSKNDIINLMHITIDETRSAYGNATNLGGADRIANFTNQTQNFRDNLSTIYAMHGEGVNLSWDVSNWSSYSYANLTETGTPNGASNWTVIENVRNSNVTVNITGSAFQIGLINSSTQWINLTTGTSTFSNATISDPYSIVFRNGNTTYGNYSITGKTNNGKNFTRARDYILGATLTFSTSRINASITIPVSVPW